MKECAFCAKLQFYAEYKRGEVFKTKHSVALVETIYKKGRKDYSGRSTDYYDKGKGYPLNFCPSCGSKLPEVSE